MMQSDNASKVALKVNVRFFCECSNALLKRSKFKKERWHIGFMQSVQKNMLMYMMPSSMRMQMYSVMPSRAAFSFSKNA